MTSPQLESVFARDTWSRLEANELERLSRSFQRGLTGFGLAEVIILRIIKTILKTALHSPSRVKSLEIQRPFTATMDPSSPSSACAPVHPFPPPRIFPKEPG